MGDLEIASIKMGMLGSAEAAKAVAAFLKRYPLRHVVLDPIVRSSSGAELISRAGFQAMEDRIIGPASGVTPHTTDAPPRTARTRRARDETPPAVLRLHETGARNVIITGGHLDPP